MRRCITLLILPVFFLASCATFGPPGPTTPAHIGTGKSLVQYDSDDARCRNLATARAGDPAQVQQSQAASAVLGTLLGAAAGAAIGGAFGGGSGAGRGAAIGGGAGLIGGLGAGTAQAQSDAARIQQRWSSEYYACMYAAGHQVPGMAAPQAPAPQPTYLPPPPPPSAAPLQSPAGAAPCRPTGKKDHSGAYP